MYLLIAKGLLELEINLESPAMSLTCSPLPSTSPTQKLLSLLQATPEAISVRKLKGIWNQLALSSLNFWCSPAMSEYPKLAVFIDYPKPATPERNLSPEIRKKFERPSKKLLSTVPTTPAPINLPFPLWELRPACNPDRRLKFRLPVKMVCWKALIQSNISRSHTATNTFLVLSSHYFHGFSVITYIIFWKKTHPDILIDIYWNVKWFLKEISKPDTSWIQEIENMVELLNAFNLTVYWWLAEIHGICRHWGHIRGQIIWRQFNTFD